MSETASSSIPQSHLTLHQMEWLKKLDDWANAYYFIAYEYEGGCSGGIQTSCFFVGGLSPTTLSEPHLWPTANDELDERPAPIYDKGQPDVLAALDAPRPTHRSASPSSQAVPVHVTPSSPHPCNNTHFLGRLIDRQHTKTMCTMCRP